MTVDATCLRASSMVIVWSRLEQPVQLLCSALCARSPVASAPAPSSYRLSRRRISCIALRVGLPRLGLAPIHVGKRHARDVQGLLEECAWGALQHCF